MKIPKNIIFPLSFSKILCIIDVAWGGENLLESIWSFRVFSSNMSIDPQEMGNCCKFDHVSKVAQRDQIVGHNVSESPEQCSVKPTILSSTMSNLPGHNVLNNLSHFIVYCC